MIGYLFFGLILNVQPNKRQNRYKRQRRNKAAESIAALRNFGYEHDNCGSQEIFRDNPGHGFTKESNDDVEKVSSAHPAVNQAEYKVMYRFWHFAAGHNSQLSTQ